MPVSKHQPIIPSEILEFMAETGQTLIVKGDAGTGKTTFVFELLNELAGEHLYVSTRISPEKVYRQLPWLKGTVAPENIISAVPTSSFFDRADVFLFSTDMPSLPDTLKLIYEKLSEKEGYKTVVIDSWDAVVQRLKSPKTLQTEKKWTREELESIILDTVKIKNANLIMVLEQYAKTPLDYQADGLVTLSKSELEGRRNREVAIEKLRGVKIGRHKYSFSLRKGRYKAYHPLPELYCGPLEAREPVPETENHLSTGIADFDALIGEGYQRGSVNLIEVERGVGVAYYPLILSTTVNQLLKDRGVLIMPPEGQRPQTFARFHTNYLGEEKVKSLVRILEMPRMRMETEAMEPESKPGVVQLTGTSIIEDLDVALVSQTLRELSDATDDEPILELLGLDTLEQSYGVREAEKFTGIRVADILGSNNVGLLIAKEGQQLGERIGQFVSTHWKVTNLNGAICIYGVVPRTGIYCIQCEEQLDVHLEAVL